MDDSSDEFGCRDEENTSQSCGDSSPEPDHHNSAEDASADSIINESSIEENGTTHEPSTDNAVEDENSSCALEHSNDSVTKANATNKIVRSSPPSLNVSSDVSSSEDSNPNEPDKSVEKMETENTFEVETSSSKEITIDLNPLGENDLLNLENDDSESDASDNDSSKTDSDPESQKSPCDSGKINCADDDSMSLDAENSDLKSTNDDSVPSEDVDSIESELIGYTNVNDADVDGAKSVKLVPTDFRKSNEDKKNFIKKVNTDLPNTELSNVDLSAFEVDDSVNKIANTQGGPMETDLLDALSDDFCGFEPSSAEDSLKTLQILRGEYDQLAHSVVNKVSGEDTDNMTDNDDASSIAESRSDGEVNDSKLTITKSANETPLAAATPNEQSIVPATVTSAASAGETSTTLLSQTIFHKSTGSFVYAVAKDVNIFEEQVPSGSKRVKKKRKFFGYDEGEDESRRRPVLTKDHEEPSKVNNISSENKENLMAADKPKDECMMDSVLPSSVPPPDTAKSQPKPPTMPSKIPVKPKRSGFDVSKPMYKEPFKHGWRREIFYRDLPEGSKSKTAYISYFNAQNKKFKTIRQIVEHLPPGSELNMTHFTFSRERIFRDNEPGSECEIIRYQKNIAKDLNSTGSSSSGATLLNRIKTMGGSSASVHDSSKSKSSKKSKVKGDDSDDEGADASSMSTAASKVTMPKILIRGVGSNSTKTPSTKSKIPLSKSSSSQKKATKSSKKPPEKNVKTKTGFNDDADLASSDYDDESAFYAYGGTGTSLTTAHTPKNVRGTPNCSMSCPPALGHPPTLQCTKCLALFHYQCCGFDGSRPITNFLCKKCQCSDDNVVGGGSGDGPADIASKYLMAVSEASNSLCLVGNERTRLLPPQNAAKIVDGVTTWLPSSSNIQLSKNAHGLRTDVVASPNADSNAALLQSVLELDGRRYIIVPKESIVSISPNATATVNTFAAEYERQQQQQQQQLRVNDAGRQFVASPDGPSNAGAPNTFLVNPSANDVNNSSAGVLLVPVMPAGGNVRPSSPLYSSRDVRGGQIGFAACETNAYRSYPLKRKHSNESDSSIRHPKMARLDAGHLVYRSSLTLSNISFLYDPLLLCLKYLTVKELLRVSMSCKYLNRMATDSSLWGTVRLKNSKITDWDGFARALRKHGTKRLDMWKMLSPTAANDVATMWDNFCRVIPTITSLERVDFTRCPSKVVETAAENCPNLIVVNALQLNNDEDHSLQLGSFAKLKHLRELRLKGHSCVKIETNTKLEFTQTDTLQVLSLTNVKNLNKKTLEAIGLLRNLRVLELGECEKLPKDFTNILNSLQKLERLRLEEVANLDPDYQLFKLLKDLRHFKSLELINFEVKMGFDRALAHCRNLEEFLLIPLYKSQSATANKLIVNGIQKLSETLKKFVWGLTTELLKVTDIFVQEYQMKVRNSEAISKTEGALDTNNGNKVLAKKSRPDSIPMLKRLSEHAENPEVDILTIAQLEKLLTSLLPSARTKVLKMPFSSTGSKRLSDCFK